jgi:hypothetical protein
MSSTLAIGSSISSCFYKEDYLEEGEELESLIVGDCKALESMKITCDQIADKLKALTEKAFAIIKKFGSSAVIIEKIFHIKVMNYKHFQKCPFSEDIICKEGKRSFYIKNLKTGQEITFPEIAIHLIRKHHFFFGKKTSKRIDPLEINKMLCIERDRDYRLITIEKTKKIWEFFWGFTVILTEHEERVKRKATEVCVVSAKITAYLLNSAEPVVVNFCEKELEIKGPIVHAFLKSPETNKYIIFGHELTFCSWGGGFQAFELKPISEEVIVLEGDEILLDENDTERPLAKELNRKLNP